MPGGGEEYSITARYEPENSADACHLSKTAQSVGGVKGG